ncbi:hypothetical protein SARC_02842 [Sphaeroforma arctica JP610]|uniref:MABP domain-containing protein n=1 Tax=Sphaeroforma arctica JP610 TaxID=667725 RepID=A0A0L0G7T1_9EUKA|nr:hypothetical protein SARC_02842 [Sphaeroforma arctica JP610]KNC84951.1 hypothetical protein SARC_02842 [Sphaeroforma arctica JP610]|eukprot:XP_014158853.1 hypothetical protein SARC_02842 [Sphaeroforma arctica JP610]
MVRLQIKKTPNGYKANLSKGLGKIKRMYVCVQYGSERPITDVDVITLDFAENPPSEYYVITRTVGGKSANLNPGFGSKKTYLTYCTQSTSRATERPITDMAVIIMSRGEKPPENMFCLQKTVSHMLSSAKVFLCYQRDAPLNHARLSLPTLPRNSSASSSTTKLSEARIHSHSESQVEGVRAPTLLSQAMQSRAKAGSEPVMETSEEFNAVNSPGSSQSHTLSARNIDSTNSLSNSLQAFLMHNSQNESPEHSCYFPTHSGNVGGAAWRDQWTSEGVPSGQENRDRLPSFASATAIFGSQAALDLNSSGTASLDAASYKIGKTASSLPGIHARSVSDAVEVKTSGLQSDRSNPRLRSRSDAPLGSGRLGALRRVYNTVHAGTDSSDDLSARNSMTSSVAGVQTTGIARTRTQEQVIYESPTANSDEEQQQAIAFLPSLRSLVAVLEQTDSPASQYEHYITRSGETNTLANIAFASKNGDLGGDGLPSYDQVEKKQNSSEYWKARGNEAFQRADYAEAIEMFSAGLRLDPTNYPLLSNRSACYFETRDTSLALEDAKKVCTLAPLWFKGYLRQGMAYGKMGRLREALGCYEKAAELHTESVGMEMEELVISTRHALAEKIWNISVHKEYATLDFERAALHLAECVKLDPFNPVMETGKVPLLLTENKYRECVNAADSILENLPSEMTALVSKALALAQMRQSRAALETIVKASKGLYLTSRAPCLRAHRLLLEWATAVSCEYYQIDYGPGASTQEITGVVALLKQLLSTEGLLIDRRVRSLVRCGCAVLLLRLKNNQEALAEGNKVLQDNPFWLPGFAVVITALGKLKRTKEAAEIRGSATKLMRDVYPADDNNIDMHSEELPGKQAEAIIRSATETEVTAKASQENMRETNQALTNDDEKGALLHQCDSMSVMWDVMSSPQTHMNHPWGLRPSDCITTIPGMQVLLPRNICIHGACLGEKFVREGVKACLFRP